MLLIRLVTKIVLLVLLVLPTRAQQLPREQWGAPDVRVWQANGKWTIAGKKNTVTLNESDLALKIQAGVTVWEMVPSSAGDTLVKAKGEEFALRLADAAKKTVTRYCR